MFFYFDVNSITPSLYTRKLAQRQMLQTIALICSNYKFNEVVLLLYL